MLPNSEATPAAAGLHLYIPQSFKFALQQPVTGPAFSKAFQVLAAVMVFGCAGWVLVLHNQGRMVIGGSFASWLYLAGGLGMMAYTLWHIWRSTTTLAQDALLQTWIWNKQTVVGELAYAKLIRFRGLEWLVAPRLYTRSLSGKLAVFYIATPSLWATAERLVLELTALRRPR